MSQIPQPPQPPRLPRAPGAPPEAKKLGGLFKRRRPDASVEEDEPEDSSAPAASPEPPATLPYETWAWPSVEPQQQKGKAPLVVLVVIALLVLAGVGFGAYKLFHKDEKSPAPAKTTPSKPPLPDRAERLYVNRVESILAASVGQRARLVLALSATENGCSIPIAQAKQRVAAVAAGRQKLLAKAKGLATPTQQAAKIKGLLTKALSASLAANRHYTAWIAGLAGASPCPGSTAANAEFKAAGAASAQASAAKQALLKAFNPLARRLGRHAWSPESI
jgi:hypothetical protein